MKNVFLFLLISFSVVAYSQDILLQQNVKADTIRPTRGPNLKNFIHGYVGIGFPLHTNEDGNYTKPVLSADFNTGIRYKRKISNNLSTGLDLFVSSAAYKIKQKGNKIIPDTIINDREKLQVNSIGSAAWLRLNVGRRGNFIGNYLDLGGYGCWNFQKKHKTTNTIDTGEKIKVSTSRLNYIETFSYGLLARIGVSRYVLTARYRISNIFKASYAMPELPRLSVGLEVGLFKN